MEHPAPNPNPAAPLVDIRRFAFTGPELGWTPDGSAAVWLLCRPRFTLRSLKEPVCRITLLRRGPWHRARLQGGLYSLEGGGQECVLEVYDGHAQLWTPFLPPLAGR